MNSQIEHYQRFTLQGSSTLRSETHHVNTVHSLEWVGPVSDMPCTLTKLTLGMVVHDLLTLYSQRVLGKQEVKWRFLMRIFGIYQADSGFMAELGYLVGKIRGTTHCQLCDITHNIAWPKAEWRNMNTRLSIPVETLHLDDRSIKMTSFTKGKTPCVIAEEDGVFRMLINAEDLEACNGDVAKFEKKLDSAL